MNDVSINTFSCSSQNLEDQNRPKLENFLGVHQEQQKSYNMYQDQSEATSHSNAANTSTIGLSMITNWLRNNPAPPPHAPDNKEEAPPPAATAQTLSLSMSTGSQSSSPLPPDNKVEAQSGAAVESLPRKSIDTFGQRTSIYRGVTRLISS